jgi:uncharacterized membrane protein YphA (DoxX/SURF4 family)
MLKKRLFVALNKAIARPEDMLPFVAEHLAYMNQLENEGKLFASGPFIQEGVLVGDGLTILQTSTIEDARVLMQAEPLIQRALREFDLRPWELREGYGLDGTGQFLEGLGFRPGRRLAELSGGLLLALGLLTPLGAALAASVMLVAAITVHLRNGCFATSGGYEFPLVLGMAALTLAFTGPGTLSSDALLGYSLSGLSGAPTGPRREAPRRLPAL